MNFKLLKVTSGVYCLWNRITNQIYVGSSKDLNARIKKHFSPRCHNSYLRRSIKKYGKDNFSITWFETLNFQAEEQGLLDYIFENKIPTFNVAVKAGGNPGGSIEGQRLLCEAGEGPQRVPLFLIDTETFVITKIKSSCEGERLGFGPRANLSHYSKLNCLNRVKTCLVAKSVTQLQSKLETWLLIPGNDTIDNPIILTLGESDSQSTLWKLANVNPSSFSKMYRKVLNPSTGEPLISAMQSKADFRLASTEVKAGDWFSCIEVL